MPRKNFSKPELNIDPSDIESLPERGMGLFIISQLTDEQLNKTAHSLQKIPQEKHFKPN